MLKPAIGRPQPPDDDGVTIDEVIAELHSRAVDDGAFEYEVIGCLQRLVAERDELRAQRDAGFFSALRLYTNEIGVLRTMRDQLEEFDARWLENDMGSDEISERLNAMLKTGAVKP